MENRGAYVALAAPTGKSCQRMTSLPVKKLKLYIGFWKWNLKTESTSLSFAHNLKNPLECDAVIVDELNG